MRVAVYPNQECNVRDECETGEGGVDDQNGTPGWVPAGSRATSDESFVTIIHRDRLQGW